VNVLACASFMLQLTVHVELERLKRRSCDFCRVNTIPAGVHISCTHNCGWTCRCFCPKYPFDLFETYEVRVICHFLSDAPRDVFFPDALCTKM